MRHEKVDHQCVGVRGRTYCVFTTSDSQNLKAVRGEQFGQAIGGVSVVVNNNVWEP